MGNVGVLAALLKLSYQAAPKKPKCALIWPAQRKLSWLPN